MRTLIARWPAVVAVIAAIVLVAACEQDDERAAPGNDQLAWGEAVHQFHCARCHAPDRSAPALTREVVLTTHADAAELFEFTREAMPMDDPGRLPDHDVWAVTAYILDREGLLDLPAGEPLDAENAAGVGLGGDQLDIEPGDVDPQEMDADGPTGR